jgi:hypothetical protein
MAQELADMGQKYFKGRVYTAGGLRVFPIVVWNGVRDYESHPPLILAPAENLTGLLHIVQVRNLKVCTETISAILSKDYDSSAILWARNAAVYRAIVENLTSLSHGRLQ